MPALIANPIRSCRVQSPAKIILAGEHAVLYNQSALVIALDLPLSCEIAYSTAIPGLSLNCFDQAHEYSWSAISQNYASIQSRYQAFLNQRQSIQSVLQKPDDLLCATLAAFTLQEPKIRQFYLSIKIYSKLPMGLGLGSSAACIVTLLWALYQVLNERPDKSKLILMAQDLESLQHGKSSGIDPHAILHGAGTWYCEGQFQQFQPRANAVQWINTGPSQSTTGACVLHSAQHFSSKTLRQTFKDLTAKMYAAWQGHDTQTLISVIRANHQVLCQIGVVPKKVQSFVQQVEALGGAAKICGAGAIAGDSAGIVLMLLAGDGKHLLQEYAYQVLDAPLNMSGTHCV